MLYTLFISNEVIPEGSAGCTKAWFIYIRPAYKEDRPLLEHEKIHVRQFWRTLGFHALFYLLSKTYRLNAEVEAYRVQLSYCNEWDKEINRQKFAERISTKYGLDITEEDAYKLL